MNADTAGDANLPPDIEYGDGLQARIQAISARTMGELRNAESPVEKSYVLNATIEEFAEVYASAETDDDEDENRINTAIIETLNQLIDSAGHNRRNYKQIYKQEKKRAAEEKSNRPWMGHVLNAVKEVTKRINTDESANGQVTYEITFLETPEKEVHKDLHISQQELTIPQGSLFDEDKFFDTFTAAQKSCYPIKGAPGDDGRDPQEWDNMVSSMLDRVGEDIDIHPGPRTAAVDELLNKVEQANAYGNLTDAIERSGIYLSDGLEDSTEIQIPREFVVSVQSKHDVGDNELQEELAAKDMTSPERHGDSVAWHTSVDNQRQILWCIDIDSVDLNDVQYAEEASDPINRMDDVAPGGNSDDSDDSENDDDDDGNNGDDGKYGIMGSSGGDGEDSDENEDADGDDSENVDGDDSENVDGDDSENVDGDDGYGLIGSSGGDDSDDGESDDYDDNEDDGGGTASNGGDGR